MQAPEPWEPGLGRRQGGRLQSLNRLRGRDRLGLGCMVVEEHALEGPLIHSRLPVQPECPREKGRRVSVRVCVKA